MEDKEIILMGDLNRDLKKPLPDHHTGKLLSLCSLYELTQVISELLELQSLHLPESI